MVNAKLSFENLEFEHHRADKCENNGFVRVHFLKTFYFDLSDEELIKIGKYKVVDSDKNSLFFDASQQRAERKFNDLLHLGFGRLRSKITGKKTVYVHRNSRIPLIGNGTFGIVDRNSSLIEIKPVTGCNLDCVFCSVDQEKRNVDFIVEKDYLVEELKKLIKYKEVGVQVFIGSQGEPLLYSDLIGLVQDISKLDNVKEIILSTNGTMLTQKAVDQLASAGLTRINLSMNALDDKNAKRICGKAYNVSHVKQIAEYIVKKMDLMITPVWVPGINDEQIEALIEYSIKIGAGKNCPPIGVQKFLEYQFGKKPAKEETWEKFYEKLEEFQKKHKVKLCKEMDKELQIVKTKKLPKPFDKGDIVKAEIIC
ncbi:MAG: radical SAM protein, partial [Nanoarchaeota archaeon]|nr:radical SAM protein [Nanoarchaeota archaeon]